ncbi:MAG: TrbC/VirB2 family protein [Holosporaceae bacterium]|nr:TrbC/VirB2 family protein [Holosporaceae bacterium]
MNFLFMSKTTKFGTFHGAEKYSSKRTKFLMMFLVFLCLYVLFGTITAYAGTANANLPWESPMTAFAASLSGPVAKALALIMIVVSVGVLVFGGDLAGWARSVTFITLAAGILGGATSFLGLFKLDGLII